MRLSNLINEWLMENKSTSHQVFYRHQFMEFNNWKMGYDVLVCTCDHNIEHDMIHIYDDYIDVYSSWAKKKPAQSLRAADQDFFTQLAELLRHTCD